MSGKGVLLVVHEDDDVVRVLVEALAERGFEVEDVATMAQATQRLDTGGVGAIVVGWTELGRKVHRWVFDHHRELIQRCILLVDGTPDDRVALTCRTCPLDDLDGLLDAAASIIGDGRPRMLLVDDDPVLLGEMAVFLETLDFDVMTASGGKAAIDLLQHAVFDVVLCDWQMPGVSGGHVHRWVAENRPELLPKMVFITGGDLDAVYDGDVRPVAVPKGLDSPTLLGHLHQALGSFETFARGTPPVSFRNVAVRAPTRPPVAMHEPDDDDIHIEIVLG